MNRPEQPSRRRAANLAVLAFDFRYIPEKERQLRDSAPVPFQDGSALTRYWS